MNFFAIHTVRFLYTKVVRPVLFLCNPESAHHAAIWFGNCVGKIAPLRFFSRKIFGETDRCLRQSLFGIDFSTPIGLAAGFDYEARLTQILRAIGFGFGTVGTITNLPYEGNPRPRLGRLPKSRSLLVNKGFKNFGIRETLKRLSGTLFPYPVGISIGKTNHVAIDTNEKAEKDIVDAFTLVMKSSVPFSYYELNISCPNLSGTVEFYSPEKLNSLLSTLSNLTISVPVFVKLPISETNDALLTIVAVIVRYPFIKGVIIGNLLRDRKSSTLDKTEVERCTKGNFSGLPCRERSDELISLVYRNYGSRIKIIGCGGIFSANDAYRKIRKGASLVELITGLVFEGPQLVAEINRGLSVLLTKDGFHSISEAVGADAS